MQELSDPLIELRFFARADRLRLLRSVVRDAAKYVGMRRQEVDNVVLAVNEACMNVIQHAYKNDPRGEIRLSIYNSNDALVFRLQDDAPCVDEKKVCSRDLDDIRPGGLGVHFIENIMDESAFLRCGEKGNLFQMIKYIRKH